MEYESHTVNVPEFAIDAYKVTNLQYLEFVDEVVRRSVLSDDDWNWRSRQGITQPLMEARGQSMVL